MLEAASQISPEEHQFEKSALENTLHVLDGMVATLRNKSLKNPFEEIASKRTFQACQLLDTLLLSKLISRQKLTERNRKWLEKEEMVSVEVVRRVIAMLSFLLKRIWSNTTRLSR